MLGASFEYEPDQGVPLDIVYGKSCYRRGTDGIRCSDDRCFPRCTHGLEGNESCWRCGHSHYVYDPTCFLSPCPTASSPTDCSLCCHYSDTQPCLPGRDRQMPPEQVGVPFCFFQTCLPGHIPDGCGNLSGYAQAEPNSFQLSPIA